MNSSVSVAKNSKAKANKPAKANKDTDASSAVSLGVFIAWQIAWICDAARFKILEKSRRIGGTWTVAYEVVRFCVAGKIPAAYFSSADLTAAKEFIAYCALWAKVFNVVAEDLGEVVLDEKKDVKAYILVVNGRKIHALSSNPKAFRSKGGMLILDEFAWHDDADGMWTAAKPTVMWGYPVRILSTHNGASSRFNRFIQQIKKGKLDWSHHRVDIFRAVADGLVDKIYGRPTTEEERAEWLRREEADCDDTATWEQEYCCNPLDESTAFLPYSMLKPCERDDVLYYTAYIGPADKKSKREPVEVGDALRGIEAALKRTQLDLYSGWDVAREGDLSVVRVGEMIGGVLFTRIRIAMRATKFKHQKQIGWLIFGHPRHRRACIDTTGLGTQVGEEAQDYFGSYRIERVHFTGPVKEALAYGLRTDIEDRTLYFEEAEEMRESLHSVRRLTTASGNARFDAARSEKTGHADDFWAMALMREAARTGATGEPIAESVSRDEIERDDAREIDAFTNYDRNALRAF